MKIYPHLLASFLITSTQVDNDSNDINVSQFV